MVLMDILAIITIITIIIMALIVFPQTIMQIGQETN
jgi:hypothetical protein